MTTLAKANIVTREAVGKLEHRFGRKGLYLGGGIILLVVLFCCCAEFRNEEKAPTRPAPRPVATAKVTRKTCRFTSTRSAPRAAFETVQIQAQVAGKSSPVNSRTART